jgi:hypothetical protein
MTTARYAYLLRRDVESLAAAHGATVKYDRDAEPRATWDRIVAGRAAKASVTVPPIETPTDYYVALHELGHIANAALDSARPERGDLYTEARAWAWALGNAAVSPSRRTWQTMYRYWITYVLDEAEWPIFDPRWSAHLQSGGADRVPAWARDSYVRLWRLVAKRGRIRVRRIRR